ncbi:porin family protein [uncultured Lacinutrix sp.]|uniref:porin family protein n=1 Tax=uncultured Lacinutrix sp. TaxID=574032 RepID=UPI00260252C4|nr:porin family protein [uncultured Lacinutrix sp.]
MKKVFLTAAIAVLSFATTQAQEIKFGVKAGVNVSKFGGSLPGVIDFGSIDYEYRTSFHVGGLAEIMLSDKFALQPELLYSSQGSKISEVDGNFNSESILKLDYVNVPIMAKFMPFEGFSIEAGPQVGFLISAKEDYTDSDGDANEDGIDIKDDVKSIDFALNLGVGYKLDNGILFSARYNFGLIDVDDADDVDNVDDIFEPKNRTLQVSVGYMF